MIKSTKALSIAESQEYINKDKEDMRAFIKNFISMDFNKAKELREKIISYEMIKLNEKHISKIIDVLPEDKEELGKILSDISLNEDETKKILDTIKEYK
jgi:DNA-directed RNA polymerase subunit F